MSDLTIFVNNLAQFVAGLIILRVTEAYDRRARFTALEKLRWKWRSLDLRSDELQFLHNFFPSLFDLRLSSLEVEK